MTCRIERPDTRQHLTACAEPTEENACVKRAVHTRLEQGRFAWPRIEDGVMRLTKGQFEALFEGLDWRRVKARPVRRPLAAE